MKKILLTVLMVLAMAWNGLCAGPYYVTYSDLGDGVELYYRDGAWPTAAVKNTTSPNDLDQYMTTLAGHTVVLDGGTSGIVYADAVLDSDNQMNISNGTTLRSAIKSDSDYSLHSGEVILRSTTAIPLRPMTRTNWILGARDDPTGGITFEATTATQYPLQVDPDATGGRAYDVKIQNSARGVYHRSDTIFERLRVSGTSNTTVGAFYSSAGSGAVNNFLFEDNGVGASIASGGTTVFTGGAIVGSEYEAVISSNAANASVFNNVIMSGNVSGEWNKHTVNNIGTGTVTLNNCDILPHPTIAGTYSTLNCTINDSLYVGPKFRANRRPFVVAFVIDDNNETEFKSIAAMCDVYGWKANWAINSRVPQITWANVATEVANGHLVIPHGHSHTTFTATNALTVTKAGQTITVAITRPTATDSSTWSGTVTVSGQSAIAISATTTLSSLKTSLEAQGCTVAYAGSYISNAARVTTLTNCAAQSIDGAGSALVFDQVPFFQVEITETQDSITANLGLPRTVIVPPGNATNATVQAAIKAAGYTGSRGGQTVSDGFKATSINIYNIRAFGASTTIGSTDVARNTAALMEMMGQLGGVCVIYDHLFTDYSEANWQIIIDTVAKSNAMVMNLANAVTWLKTYDPSGDLATADGMTYTRTMVNAPDYRLRPDSLLIRAGKFVPGANDQGLPGLLGDYVYRLPPIGFDYKTGLPVKAQMLKIP